MKLITAFVWAESCARARNQHFIKTVYEAVNKTRVTKPWTVPAFSGRLLLSTSAASGLGWFSGVESEYAFCADAEDFWPDCRSRLTVMEDWRPDYWSPVERRHVADAGAGPGCHSYSAERLGLLQWPIFPEWGGEHGGNKSCYRPVFIYSGKNKSPSYALKNMFPIYEKFNHNCSQKQRKKYFSYEWLVHICTC